MASVLEEWLDYQPMEATFASRKSPGCARADGGSGRGRRFVDVVVVVVVSVSVLVLCRSNEGGSGRASELKTKFAAAEVSSAARGIQAEVESESN